MAPFRPFWRRDNVLKSGTAQSSPANLRENSPPDCFLTLLISSRLATSPVVCRDGSPNSTFRVRQAWISASVNVAGRHRLTLGAALWRGILDTVMREIMYQG